MAYKEVYYPHSKPSKDAQLHRDINLTAGNSSDDYFKSFDRLYSIYPDYEMTNLIQYIFLVRPDLNISDAVDGSSYFKMMKSTNPSLLNMLTHGFSYQHDFIPMLVGRTESLQIPDLSIKTYNLDQPYTGFRLPYAGTSIESRTGGSFDITFRETIDLRIHKFFQAWLNYINDISYGLYDPKDKYIRENKMDYATSVYQIVCLPDAETIVWWSKYTGCIPKNVANSDFSFNLRGNVDSKTSVQFDYFMHEAHEAESLADFAENSVNGSRYTPLYNGNTLSAGNGLVGAPFIEAWHGLLKLRWSPK